MNKLVFKRTNSGQLQVHHEKETDRDDYFDALMMATYVLVNPENAPVTLNVVDNSKSQLYSDLDVLLMTYYFIENYPAPDPPPPPPPPPPPENPPPVAVPVLNAPDVTDMEVIALERLVERLENCFGERLPFITPVEL